MKKDATPKSGIAYTVVGEGMDVVFLHGFCGSRAYWSTLESPLKSQVRAYYLDLPGHGESEPHLSDRLDAYVELLHDWKKEAGLDQFVLVGHSLGGYITLAYVEKYPQDVTAFALVHSTAFPDSDEGKEGRDGALKKVEEDGLDAFIEGLVPKLFDSSFATTHPEVIENVKKIGLETQVSQVSAFLKTMRDRKDMRHVLTKTDIPHLVVAGENDQVIPPYKSFIGEQSNATEKLIADAAHMSMYEQPDELRDTVMNWLQSLSFTKSN